MPPDSSWGSIKGTRSLSDRLVAANRGRNVIAWSLLCALFPPLLVVIYFSKPLCEVEGKIPAMFELRGTNQVARTGLQTVPDGAAGCEVRS